MRRFTGLLAAFLLLPMVVAISPAAALRPSSTRMKPAVSFSYTYNAVGDLTKTVNTQGGSTAPVETTCYTHDTLRQLTQAWSATDACAKNPSTSGNATVNGPQPWWTTWTIDTPGGSS